MEYFRSILKMIDKETRRRILELWRDGKTKTAIRKETGISAPSIRQIIRESESSAQTYSDYWHPMRSGDTLLLNLTRVWPPGRSRNPWQQLMNGIAIRMLYSILLEIYPQNLAYEIFNEVNMNDGDGKILEVSIYHDEKNKLIVKSYPLFP
jgi:hypothetical protein